MYICIHIHIYTYIQKEREKEREREREREGPMRVPLRKRLPHTFSAPHVFTDFSQVDILCLRYKFVECGEEKSTSSLNWCVQIVGEQARHGGELREVSARLLTQPGRFLPDDCL